MNRQIYLLNDKGKSLAFLLSAFFHGLAAGIWNIHKVGPYDSDVLGKLLIQKLFLQ